MSFLMLKKDVTSYAVGKHVGVSRQYIDAISRAKPGSTSPANYKTLCAIDDFICETDEGKEELLWLGFKAKIRKDLEFYLHFHAEKTEEFE